MARYGCHFAGFGTLTTAKTAATLVPASTNILCECVEAIMTGDGATTPADIEHMASLAKSTIATAGTSTTVTPDPNDDAANAARTVTKVKYSAEGTTITTLYPVSFSFNQRGGMRWAVNKGDGMIIYQPLTNKGIALMVISSSAGTVSGSLGFIEP